MFPSSTSSSTLSESACSARDKPSKSPDWRSAIVPFLGQGDSNSCARRTWVPRFWTGVVFDVAFFLDCFFLTTLFECFGLLARSAFFARFAVVVFDPVRLLLLFFLEGISAVYHRSLIGGRSAAEAGGPCHALSGYL